MAMSEIIMDELYYDTQLETAARGKALLQKRFAEVYGKKKGAQILEGIFARITDPTRCTQRRLIITSHPTYRSKYLHKQEVAK